MHYIFYSVNKIEIYCLNHTRYAIYFPPTVAVSDIGSSQPAPVVAFADMRARFAMAMMARPQTQTTEQLSEVEVDAELLLFPNLR